MVTESAAAPTASTPGWSANPPASYSCSTTGARTLYAWARDAAGNVSASRSASTTVSGTPPVTDGAALYAANCAGCHNPLASSAKRGRSATQIQNAINNNTGGMGSLSSLTSAQVAAIATALASSSSSDTTAPTVTAFSIPATSASTPFRSAPSRPRIMSVSPATWSPSRLRLQPPQRQAGATNPPASYTCSTTGARTLYAWARDAAGNVSASRSASTTFQELLL